MAQEETPSQPPRLLQQVREKIRYKHYSIRTEAAYIDWIKRFIFFHERRHPRDMGAAEIEQFLTHLAVAGKVAAATQNQAKSALLFLYREVLVVPLPWLDNIESAKTPKRQDAQAPTGCLDAGRGVGNFVADGGAASANRSSALWHGHAHP
jgi:hypothetical protein